MGKLKSLLLSMPTMMPNFKPKTYEFTEYHARRTLEDPKLWVVVKVVLDKDDRVIDQETLSIGMKRNRAEAIVRLMRSNQLDENQGS
jgi:hypothetical protein